MLIIGIAGGTGSGKTTVVKKIMESLPAGEVTLLSQDAYYKDNSHIPLEERRQINFDHPNSIEFELLAEHIQKLKNGETIYEPTYDYKTCCRLPETVKIEPTKVILVEGILILSNQLIRDLSDIKVFVSADADDRLIRVIRRDMVERGRAVEETLKRYHETVKPMHLQFIEPSMQYADIIIPQGGHNKVAIKMLTTTIKEHLLNSK